MGLLFVQALRRSLAAHVTAFDIDVRRLELAHELGANQMVDLKDGIPADARAGFDVVIETAGTGQSMNSALALARSGAIIENFAWHHHEQAFDLEDWHVKGWRILNIQPGMNPHFGDLFPRSVALMAAGTISNARLVTHAGPVAKAAEIFRAGAEKSEGYIKGVIIF
jgi:threonine dehydrogenase-like Zn-dependent dehydrogenase